jgi:hypothetical protein
MRDTLFTTCRTLISSLPEQPDIAQVSFEYEQDGQRVSFSARVCELNGERDDIMQLMEGVAFADENQLSRAVVRAQGQLTGHNGAAPARLEKLRTGLTTFLTGAVGTTVTTLTEPDDNKEAPGADDATEEEEAGEALVDNAVQSKPHLIEADLFKLLDLLTLTDRLALMDPPTNPIDPTTAVFPVTEIPSVISSFLPNHRQPARGFTDTSADRRAASSSSASGPQPQHQPPSAAPGAPVAPLHSSLLLLPGQHPQAPPSGQPAPTVPSAPLGPAAPQLPPPPLQAPPSTQPTAVAQAVPPAPLDPASPQPPPSDQRASLSPPSTQLRAFTLDETLLMPRRVLASLCSLHNLSPHAKRVPAMRNAILAAGVGRFPGCAPDLKGDFPLLRIVFAGDGFNVGKKRKFLQVLLHFLNDGRDALSVRQRFNVALADCAESRHAYEQMRLWNTVNSTQGMAWRHPLTGTIFRLKYYLSGDWVFMKTILGISDPNQEFFCLWCFCPKRLIADPDQKWTVERTGKMEPQEARERPDLTKLNKLPTDEQPGTRIGTASLYHGIAQHLLRANYNSRPARALNPGNNIMAALQAWDHKAWKASGRRTQLLQALRDLYKADSAGDRPNYRGQRRPSLVHMIEFPDCVIDVLHTFLRVTDVLLSNLVEDACRFGLPCLEQLKVAIRACGLPNWSFRVGGEGLSPHKVTWDSLDGADKLKIVDNIKIESVFSGCIPDKLPFNLKSRVNLWASWGTLYTHLREWQIEISSNDFRALCHGFLREFLGLRHVPRSDKLLTKCELFARPPTDDNLYYDKDVTPYIHALAYHVPELFDRHGLGLMQFSCFAGEKQNHLRASQFFKQTSHGGGKTKKSPVEQLFAVQLRCTFNPFVRGRPKFRCGVASCPRGYDHLGNLQRHHRLRHSAHPPPRAATDM